MNEKDNDNEDQPKSIWFLAYNEFCFSDSPNDVNKKLPEKFGEVEWDPLPIAYDDQLDIFVLRLINFLI